MKGAFENPYIRNKENYIVFWKQHKDQFIKINSTLRLKWSQNKDGKSVLIHPSSTSAFKRQLRSESFQPENFNTLNRTSNTQSHEFIDEKSQIKVPVNKSIGKPNARNIERNSIAASSTQLNLARSPKFKIREKRESKLVKKA